MGSIEWFGERRDQEQAILFGGKRRVLKSNQREEKEREKAIIVKAIIVKVSNCKRQGNSSPPYRVTAVDFRRLRGQYPRGTAQEHSQPDVCWRGFFALSLEVSFAAEGAGTVGQNDQHRLGYMKCY